MLWHVGSPSRADRILISSRGYATTALHGDDKVSLPVPSVDKLIPRDKSTSRELIMSILILIRLSGCFLLYQCPEY